MGKQEELQEELQVEHCSKLLDCPHCVCRRHSWSLFGNGIPTLLRLAIGVSK